MYWLLGRRSKLSLPNKLLTNVYLNLCGNTIYNLGLCEAVPYTNHPTTAVKNPAVHNKRAVVRFYLHATQ